jgi:murein DD-endopeptidase MepM/ murein hydrolase activator NlpD
VLAYPVLDPVVTQGYGATAFARRAYRTGFHNGVDFKASIGAPIIAADAGSIMAVGDNGRVQYGKYVLVKHDNNLVTLYAHLSRVVITKGDYVKVGQVVGYAGSTGYSTGPHLHFTVYWGPSVTLKSFPGAGLVPIGVTINPEEYL